MIVSNYFFPRGILALIGIYVVYRRKWIAIPTWILLYAVAFIFINPPYSYDWYRFPYWIFNAALIAWGVEGVAGGEFFQKYRFFQSAPRRTTAAVIMMLLSVIIRERRQTWHADRNKCYTQVVDYLDEKGIKPKKVAMEEIGIMGYRLMDSEIVDIERLVHKKPLIEVIGDAPPDYAIFREHFNVLSVYADGRFHFRGSTVGTAIYEYEQVAKFGHRNYRCTLLKFKRGIDKEK